MSDNIYKKIKEGEEISVGTFETTIKISEGDAEAKREKPTITFSGSRTETQRLLSYTIDNGGEITRLDNAVLYGNGTCYINVGLAAKGITSVRPYTSNDLDNIENKWVALPFYTANADSAAYKRTIMNHAVDILESVTESLSIPFDDGVYTLAINDHDMLTALLQQYAADTDYISENLASIFESVGLLESFTSLEQIVGDKMDVYENLAAIINTAFDCNEDERISATVLKSMTASEAAQFCAEHLSLKLNDIASGIAETDETCYLNINISYTGHEGNRVYTKNIEAQYPYRGGMKTVSINSVFTENSTADITPPNDGDIAATDAMLTPLSAIASLYAQHQTQSNLVDIKPVQSEERVTPKYVVETKGHTIICVRETPLFTEKITYITDGTVVKSINMTLTTRHSALYNAFKDYYIGAGFKVTISEDAYFTAVETTEPPTAEYATLIMDATDATVLWWIENVPTFEQLLIKVSN